MPFVESLSIDQTFAVALCAVVVSGVLRGYSGFGAALIIIPIFSNLYSPLTALSFHILVEMPTLLVLLPTALKTYDKKLVNFSLLSLVLAVPLGFSFISLIDAVFLRLFIGVIVVVSVFLIWRGVPLRFSKNNIFFQLACGVSGFCQGLVGLGGPPVVTASCVSASRSLVQPEGVYGGHTPLHHLQEFIFRKHLNYNMLFAFHVPFSRLWPEVCTR